MNYERMAQTCLRLIDKNGRMVRFSRLTSVDDADMPWNKDGPQIAETVTAKGVFIVANTSIPTVSRGLGLDWISEDLLKKARSVVMLAAKGVPDLSNFHIVRELNSERQNEIIWGQALQPADVKLMYILGLRE